MSRSAWGQTAIDARELGGAGPVPIGGEVFHNVAGAAESFEIVKESQAQYIVIRGEAGTHRVRPGKLIARDFITTDVDTVTDEITEVAHGYETGDGPLRLSSSGTLPGGLSIDTDVWVIKIDDDTFQLALRPGNARRIKQTGPNSTIESDAIPIDLLDVGSGTHSIGGNLGAGNAVGFGTAVVDPPAADLAEGGSVPLIASEEILFTGKAITVRATAASDVLTWWFV